MTSSNISDEELKKIIEENKRLSMENALLRTASTERKVEGEGFLSRLWSGFKTSKIPRRSSDSDLNLNRISLEPSAPMYETPNKSSSNDLIPVNLERAGLGGDFEKAGDSAVSSIRNLNKNSEKADETAIPNYSSPDSILINELVTASSMIARQMIKTNEKDEVGSVKGMKSVDIEGILLFLGKYIPDSAQSAVYQVPKELRVALKSLGF